MSVALIGFMGSGKTTVAAILARRLGWQLCELDDVIIAQSGLASIPAIFEERGEEGFRALETAAVAAAVAGPPTVISAGGGVVTRRANMEFLRSAGVRVLFLDTTLEEIFRRVGTAPGRPLFSSRENVKKLYAERLPLYKSYADMIVPTDGKSPETVAEEITGLLEHD